MPAQDGPEDDPWPGPGDIRVADFDDVGEPARDVRRAGIDDGTWDGPDERSGAGSFRVVDLDADGPDDSDGPGGSDAPGVSGGWDGSDDPGVSEERPGGGAVRVASFGDRSAGRGSRGTRPARRGTRRGSAGPEPAVRADRTTDSGRAGSETGTGAAGDRPESAGAGRGTGGRTRRGRRGTADDGERRGTGPGHRGGEPPDEEARAREICLRLLTDRARTVKELADALRRKEIPDDVAGRVLERFDEVGLVDDEAFAGQWVRSRHRHKGLGRRALAAELHRKGVAKEIADTALTEIDAESEAGRARELVDRKLRTMSVGTRDERLSTARRLVGMLARKGYGSGIAYSVVREAIAARGAADDELGEGPDDD